MADLLVLPHDAGCNGSAPASREPPVHSLASLLKRERERAQQEAALPANVAQRIASTATRLSARLSDSLRARVHQSLEERRLLHERRERQQILELRMANVSKRETRRPSPRACPMFNTRRR